MTTRLDEIEVIVAKWGSNDVPDAWVLQLVAAARAAKAYRDATAGFVSYDMHAIAIDDALENF